MRKIRLHSKDFEMFDADFHSGTYEFFCKHSAAFCDMWLDQGREFWKNFLTIFRSYTSHGYLRDFYEKKGMYVNFVDQAFTLLQAEFVEDKANCARRVIYDIANLSRSTTMLEYLESKSYVKDPFYNKETREVFRKFYGPADEKASYLKAYFLVPIYQRFAAAVVTCLRRWLVAPEMDPNDDSYYERFSDSEISYQLKNFSKSKTLYNEIPEDLKKEVEEEITLNKSTKKIHLKKKKKTKNGPKATSESVDSTNQPKENIPAKSLSKNSLDKKSPDSSAAIDAQPKTFGTTQINHPSSIPVRCGNCDSCRGVNTSSPHVKVVTTPVPPAPHQHCGSCGGVVQQKKTCCPKHCPEHGEEKAKTNEIHFQHTFSINGGLQDCNKHVERTNFSTHNHSNVVQQPPENNKSNSNKKLTQQNKSSVESATPQSSVSAKQYQETSSQKAKPQPNPVKTPAPSLDPENKNRKSGQNKNSAEPVKHELRPDKDECQSGSKDSIKSFTISIEEEEEMRKISIVDKVEDDEFRKEIVEIFDLNRKKICTEAEEERELVQSFIRCVRKRIQFPNLSSLKNPSEFEKNRDEWLQEIVKSLIVENFGHCFKYIFEAPPKPEELIETDWQHEIYKSVVAVLPQIGTDLRKFVKAVDCEIPKSKKEEETTEKISEQQKEMYRKMFAGSNSSRDKTLVDSQNKLQTKSNDQQTQKNLKQTNQQKSTPSQQKMAENSTKTVTKAKNVKPKKTQKTDSQPKTFNKENKQANVPPNQKDAESMCKDDGVKKPRRPLKLCSHCSKQESSPREFKKCARCKQMGFQNPLFYCSKNCQIEDWQSRHCEQHRRLEASES